MLVETSEAGGLDWLNRIRIFLAEEKEEDTLGGGDGDRLSLGPHIHSHVSSDCPCKCGWGQAPASVGATLSTGSMHQGPLLAAGRRGWSQVPVAGWPCLLTTFSLACTVRGSPTVTRGKESQPAPQGAPDHAGGGRGPSLLLST